MQVAQIPGPPPNQGRIYFPTRGCTAKSRNAPLKMEKANGNMRGSAGVRPTVANARSRVAGLWANISAEQLNAQVRSSGNVVAPALPSPPQIAPWHAVFACVTVSRYENHPCSTYVIFPRPSELDGCVAGGLCVRLRLGSVFDRV